jgi:hypothetical protein
MDLVNELSNELALTFLVERKYAEKVKSSDVLSLIDKIKEILHPQTAENPAETKIQTAKNPNFSSH